MAKAKEIKSRLKKEGEFIPPDGGWGWMIILAAGLSNVSFIFHNIYSIFYNPVFSFIILENIRNLIHKMTLTFVQ